MSTETKTREIKERIFLTNKDKITVFENNLVTLTLENGTVYEALEPRRLFPVNMINQYITLLSSDNKEIAIIREMGDLDKDSRQVVQQSLDDYYLIPTITKIISVSDKHGTLRWCIESDRGIKEFDIRNRNTDIKVYSDGRVRIRDSDDNRYVIEDYRDLDSHSKKLLIMDM